MILLPPLKYLKCSVNYWALFIFYLENKLNSEFNLIELGPGKGTLFKDIAKSVINYPNFPNKAKIEFIEINKNLINIEKDNLKN